MIHAGVACGELGQLIENKKTWFIIRNSLLIIWYIYYNCKSYTDEEGGERYAERHFGTSFQNILFLILLFVIGHRTHERHQHQWDFQQDLLAMKLVLQLFLSLWIHFPQIFCLPALQRSPAHSFPTNCFAAARPWKRKRNVLLKCAAESRKWKCNLCYFQLELNNEVITSTWKSISVNAFSFSFWSMLYVFLFLFYLITCWVCIIVCTVFQ